jgi:hypothetical protein
LGLDLRRGFRNDFYIHREEKRFFFLGKILAKFFSDFPLPRKNHIERIPFLLIIFEKLLPPKRNS